MKDKTYGEMIRVIEYVVVQYRLLRNRLKRVLFDRESSISEGGSEQIRANKAGVRAMY